MNEESLQPVVLASGNAGKLAELELLLRPFSLRLHLQSEFDVPDAEETGLSFIENAILKARHASAITGLPALADDSGLEVMALQGKPGIYSARFALMHDAGQGDAANNQLLLKKLLGQLPEARSARFRCVLAYMRHAEDPSPLIAEGSWYGRILEAASGDGGFGYDPIFHANDQQCAAAELSAEEKAAVSHRGLAIRQLLQLMNSQAAELDGHSWSGSDD